MCNSVRNIGQDNYFNEKKTSYIVHKSPTKVKVVTLFADIGQIGICYHGAKCIFFEMCIKVYSSYIAALLSYLRSFLNIKSFKGGKGMQNEELITIDYN